MKTPTKHLEIIKIYQDDEEDDDAKKKSEAPTASEIVQEMKDQGLNWCYHCGQKTFVRKQLRLDMQIGQGQFAAGTSRLRCINLFCVNNGVLMQAANLNFTRAV